MSILNALSPPVTHKRGVYLWNLTVFAKCFRLFWIRENCGSKMWPVR
jgi:hypothetical protein